MTTPKDKNNWNDRLKTADNAYVSEFLNNFGLNGNLSLKDIPWAGIAGVAAMGLSSKLKERKERRAEEGADDHRNIRDFSDDISKIRDIIDQRRPDEPSVRNHPSYPGFNPEEHTSFDPHGMDARSPYGIFDDEDGRPSYPEQSASITNISEHPRFNSSDQGKTQRGRPFDRDEE